MAKQWGDVLKGVAVGSVIGVATGVLFAPKSGKETREEIKKKAEELSMKAKTECEKTLEKTKKVYEDMTGRFKRDKEMV
jgi:gas vesicle protein